MKQSKMKRVTKNNLLTLITWIKEYEKNECEQLKNNINNYIDNVINNDKRYYNKLNTYDFNNDQLKYLI